jgi:hypothetical protein
VRKSSIVSYEQMGIELQKEGVYVLESLPRLLVK